MQNLGKLTIALVMLATGTVIGVTTQQVVAGQPAPQPGFVPIQPCRLLDTRLPGGAPIGPQETRTVDTNGNPTCNVPPEAGAAAVAVNITAVDPTKITFLTIFEDGKPVPNTSTLNPAPGHPPASNGTITPVSPDGKFSVYNFQGRTDYVIDLRGYFVGPVIRPVD